MCPRIVRPVDLSRLRAKALAGQAQCSPLWYRRKCALARALTGWWAVLRQGEEKGKLLKAGHPFYKVICQYVI